jgi:hypothetical protein
MTSPWIRSVTSCITALSLLVALVVGVFAQSHAAMDEAAQAGTVEPCPGHMEAPVVAVSENDCLTLCDAADIDHLRGVLSDRIEVQDLVASVFVYDATPVVEPAKRSISTHSNVRGPPGNGLYLITQRLRL